MNNDKIYEAYIGTFGEEFQKLTIDRLNWITAHINENDSVLDIGCSQGIVSILAAQKCRKVIGIDIEHEAIDFARQLLDKQYFTLSNKVTFLCEDFMDFSLEEKFDRIIITEVLEHLENPEEVLEHASKLLTPAGQLIVTVPFGINNHPDHKRTYYLQNFIALFKGRLNILDIVFINRWMGAVCQLGTQQLSCARKEILDAYDKNWFNIDSEMKRHTQELYDDLMKANGKYKEALQNYEKAKEWVDSLKKKNSFLEKEYSDIKESNTAIELLMSTRINELQDNLKKSNENYREALQNYEKAKEWVENSNEKYGVLSDDYQKLATSHKTLLEERETLIDKYEVLSREYNKMKEDHCKSLAEYTQKESLSEEIIQQLSSEIEKAYKEFDSDILMLQELKSKINKLDVQNNYLKSENEAYRRKIQMIKDTKIGSLAIRFYHFLKRINIKI